MNWSRAKTILIIFFIVINMILLGTIIHTTNKSDAVSTEVLDATVEILNSNKILIKKELIPTKHVQIPYVEVNNIVGDYNEFAKKMLMSETLQKGEQNTYYANEQIITFTADNFQFTTKTPLNSDILLNINDTNIEEKTKLILKRYGFNYKDIKVNWLYAENKYIITVMQTINGSLIFDSSLKIECSKDGLYSIYGTWFEKNTKYSNVDVKLKSVTSILIDFIAKKTNTEDIIQIMSLEQGYSVYENETYHKTLMLIPVWQITLEDGTTHMIDARQTT